MVHFLALYFAWGGGAGVVSVVVFIFCWIGLLSRSRPFSLSSPIALLQALEFLTAGKNDQNTFRMHCIKLVTLRQWLPGEMVF